MASENIFQHVLVVGPSYTAQGGISSVIRSYKENFSGLTFLSTFQRISDPFLKKLFILFRGLFLFQLYLFNRRIRIVHIHTASWNSFYRKSVFLFLAKIFRKKVVLHIHGCDFCDVFLKKHPKICRFVLKHADTHIVVSPVWKQQLSDFGLRMPVYSVGNFVTIPEETADPGIEKFPVPVLFMSRLSAQKGADCVLEMIEKYRNDFYNKVHFDIAGSGELSDKFIALANQEKISDFVTFHGWVDGEKKHGFLRRAAILIQPSKYESFGISILESMSYGIATIASNVGGIPDLICDNRNGLLIEPDNSRMLKDAVMTLVDSPEKRKEFGSLARIRACDFSKEVIEQQLICIFCELLPHNKKTEQR